MAGGVLVVDRHPRRHAPGGGPYERRAREGQRERDAQKTIAPRPRQPLAPRHPAHPEGKRAHRERQHLAGRQRTVAERWMVDDSVRAVVGDQRARGPHVVGVHEGEPVSRARGEREALAGLEIGGHP